MPGVGLTPARGVPGRYSGPAPALVVPRHGIRLGNGGTPESVKICGHMIARGVCPFGQGCKWVASHGMTLSQLKQEQPGTTMLDEQEQRGRR